MRADALIKTSRQSFKGHDVGDELTCAWNGLTQSKAALRQIENKLEAGPGTGVLLEPVLNPAKKKSLRKSQSKESQQRDHDEATTKRRSNCQHSPEKSISRSPLRNCTQDNTVRHSVEFREPVASYREATPPPHPSAPSDLYSLQSVPGSSHLSQQSSSNPSLSHLVYQRDTRDKQTEIDLNSTHSSAMENMEVRYLNDQPALDTLRTNPSHPPALTGEAVLLDSSLKAQFRQNHDSRDSTSDFRCKGESTPSSSPGSASQRLENLRRHQPDDKLEKLKERIRKQRQHLEETAGKEKLGSYLEQAVVGSGNSGTCTMPKVKVRKVATAPSAPIYKGFNSTETKIQTPDGKIWNEEEFRNLSREIYKDLTQQFVESTKSQPPKGQREWSKERKPVRKVQKVAASDLNAKPVISPASWREGQKLVKMVLSKDPRLTTEESQTNKRKNVKASYHRSSSDPRSEINQQMCPQKTSKKHQGIEFNFFNARSSPKAVQELTPLPISSGMSADIMGVLDDLQLDCKTEHGDRARPRSRRGTSGRQARGSSGSRARAPVSTWATTATTRGSHSASPSNRSRAVNADEARTKKRHYDADSVRQYIAQQQEKRKRQQVEEKKALREDAEKRHQRLQELYRKQREVVNSAATSTVVPAQLRLQETFNKLLLEGAHLKQEGTQMRPMYQPSGESDKENMRLEQEQSPSSSDRSLNHPPVSRNGLDYGEASSAHPEQWIPVAPPVTSPVCSNEHLLSQLLRLESALTASEKLTQRPVTTPRHSPAKASRIEALKATANSLSSRTESEARKLAGEGFNYGLPTALDVDSILAPRSLHPQYGDHGWTEVAVNASNSSENEDLAERILGTRRMNNGTGFAGQDFYSPKEKSRRVNSRTQSRPNSAQHGSYFHDKRVTKDVEINPITGPEDKNLDSSSASISEGPLSEGSLTEGEQSPSHSTNAFRPIGHQGAVQHSGRKSHQRLSEFQKDAENYAALSSLLAHQENPKPAWEELNKGSPLSVINIFTKSLHGNAKVTDMNVERNLSSAHLLPSSSYVADLVYENDFVSPQSSRASGQKDFNSSSNHYEELLRRSSEKRTGGRNAQRSSCSTPGSSPHSKSSTKRSKISDQSDVTLVEEHRSSPSSEALSSESRKRDSKRSPEHSQATLGDISGISQQSSQMDEKMSPPSRLRQSPNGSLDHSSSLESNSLRRSSPENTAITNTAHPGLAEIKASGELQYTPEVLQQRLAAELHYLESIEESVRQLGDIERLMGVSVAQHESASLTQILKAKQQQHEQELFELKIKAEREALETKLQMEENKQRVAQAHIELQGGLAATQKETLEGLQEATTKMMSQQAEAARYAADTARHIKEMTEMAHAQLITFKHIPVHSELRKEHSHAKNTDKANESYESSSRTRTEKPHSAVHSFSHSDHSDSASFRRPGLSEPDSSYHLNLSSEHKEKMNQEGKRREPPNEKMVRAVDSISIEEEVPAALNESLCSSSIPSAVEEKGDTTSVATEYSHKFDESITEDEIEERSFRSLLPSEAHRRESLDKKFRHHDESEEDGASHNSTPASGAHNVLKPQDVSSTFSGGQDSFSHFTMEMVRQYMRDEEVRLQHQSALLRLRQKALKEKTRAELAWLEHQKKKLRDKGEDDKMPPIKKKQRGLLLKLQQEQAEIKRLQEANKAARKERQLLLKQQEEIERMRSSTLKLKERLRCATTEAPSDTSLSEVVSSNVENAEPDVCSPSPSVSGSETSSIMQKLKKMRSQTDEKFLTKREQQLMQRRHHAEELLLWKQRLDQEEAEVRKMEKKALAAWDGQTSQNKGHDHSEIEKDFSTSPGQRQKVEVDASAAAQESSIHTDVEGQDESPVLTKYTSASEIASIQSSSANYTDDFTSVATSPNRQKSTFKGDEVFASPSELNSKAEIHHNLIHQMPKQRETTDSPTTRQTEPISDQSDIESRIKALKEELKKRKFTAHQLRKEQKKRTKERLKAQEANLLKQLETYNDFIEKTKAELNNQPDSAPDTKSQITRHPSDYRSDTIKTPESLALVENALLDRTKSPSMPSTFSDEDPATVTSTPRHNSPDCFTSGPRPLSKDTHVKTQGSKHQKIISEVSLESLEVLEEELKLDVSKLSEDQESGSLLRLNKENKMDTTPESRSHHSASVGSVQDRHVDSRHQPDAEAAEKSTISIDMSVGADISTAPDASSNKRMQKETSKQDKASPVADGYYNTFESSVDASLRDDGLILKPAADSDKTSLQQDVPAYYSPEEEIAEEIAEDISGLSVVSNGSRHFTKVRDSQANDQAFRPDDKSPVNSVRSLSVTPVADEMPGFNIGDRVVVSGVQPGILRFKGPTCFANGFWAGVELDKSEGSNNGTYDGVLYFECAEQHGIFAPPDKVTHLTDKFELFTDITEDDDSFNDDMSEDENEKCKTKQTKSQKQQRFRNDQIYESGDNKITDDAVHLENALLKSHHGHPIPNGTRFWDYGGMSPSPLIEDTEKVCEIKQAKTEVTNLSEKSDVELNHQLIISSDLKNEDGLKDKLGSFADKLLNNLVKDTVQQFAELKKSKAKKINDAGVMNGNVFDGFEESLALTVDQKDGLPFFLSQEKEELSSPELHNRPESPVLGASGQEELAKRLAELELSRELDEFGDDQDWFDEDFGLSSRREQQRLKQRQRAADEQAGHGKTVSGTGTVMGGLVPSSGDQQVKTPPRPELPLPMPPKLPEEPAMVVPHSATEVEKMAQAAALEIWETCGLNREETMILAQQQKPNPSPKYFGEEPYSEDQEAVCLRSYKKAVFDLTWEILQDIFAEDPNANQPQWIKPQRVKSSFQRVRTPGDIGAIQEFVTAEVLKLYGLTKNQDQQTDWPKILKFGRKKRDRVDNILVQELHEEESQWVNYDEDELLVKMQLADSIFDALLKDTADVLTQIYDKRSQKGSFS